MLYKNCHYRCKDQICELIDFLYESEGSDSKVKIRYTNGKETTCLTSELTEIPLTESILQSCYKSKTYVRDGNWDIIWHLGGKNNVTVGEKSGHYYILPTEKAETVLDILPYEFVICPNKTTKIEESIEELNTIGILERSFPEIRYFIK